MLSVDSRNIDNRNGSLLSVNNTQLTVSDDLDNRHGEIATNRQLSIHDKNQNTLALNNADGTIQSASNISLQAKSLANNGTLTAGNKLDIALADDFVVERDLTAGNQLNLSTKGRLKNTHTLQAGHTLKLNAGNIDNQVTGKIIAGEQTDITSEQHVDNRGLINSNGLTRISAGQTLTNTGTGKIYGNHIALGAQKLLNREETAEGGTKAGVIAVRERLDIGARETGNRNDALISSEGRLNIGGSLDGNNEASGRATLLTNTGAKIEAGSDARISADKLYNLNADFRVEDYIDSQRHLQSFYRNAEAVPFFTQDDGHHLKEDHDLNFYFKDGRHIHIHKYGVEGIWKADYTQTVYKQHIIADRPGEILIGGNLDAQGNWSNQNSRILAGLDLNSDGITNLATLLMKVRTANDGMMRRGSYDRHGFRGHRHIEFDKDAHPVVSPPIRETEFERPVSTVKQHAGNLQPAGQAGLAGTPRPDLSDSLTVKSNTGTVKLPSSSLYTVHPGNKGWLVETDPQFADYRRWLSSDYMLQQLKLDTNHLHKRLGDGYYEQKLINEQIHQLTGYRRLDGYKSDEEQFKALMDNGLTAAKTFGLTPGIALSAEQVARLTSDIVWMENQTVTLSDGSTQTVLAPKVYALARKGDLNTSGGLISAEQVLLKLQNGNLTNSGTIAGRQAVLIQARNINSNGNIQADQIGLKAEKSINVDGGQVQAGRLLTAQAQNINLNGTTQTSGNQRNGNTIVDRIAQISVTGAYTRGADNSGTDGILALRADNDINLNAATVSNQVKGGTTQITAGNNLNLGTIRTEHREAYGALDDENHRHVRQSAEVGSSIHTQNGALLKAGNDLKIRQGELEAEEGKTVLAAGRDVTISEGRQITELDTSVSVKRKGILSSTKTHDRYRFSHDEAVGSNIGGGKMIVAAGQDINVRGSNLISDNGTVLKAGHDIDISTAHTSDEVGPLDDQQMETNRIALLRLQGRDYDAGRIYEYNHATRQRLMWYQLPVMELAGRIPSKLANKYKLYREGKLSAAQLAAEIKKQAPVVPNGKAFDFTSGALIPNQTVKLTQAQNLSNGTTLPAGTIARLTGKGVEATLPNGKNVSYAGVTEQRALPAPRSPSLSSSLNGLSKSDQAIINHLAKDGVVLTYGDRAAIARTARDSAVNPIPTEVKKLEGRTIGKTLTQNQAVQADANYLKSLNATDIRINQQQVNGDFCRVGICRPDLQATLPSGKRVYIEYDRSTSSRGMPHADRIFSNDKDAIVILRTLD